MESNAELNNLIKKLVVLGEDPGELELWKEVFPGLDEEAQLKILENLSGEVKQLEDLNKG